MSLRHHLRTDEHIALTASKAAQNIFVGKLGDGRILVHTQHAHLRQRFQLLLRLLRARPEELDAPAVTAWALRRDGSRIAAIMAAQVAVRAVINHRHGTMRTGYRLAAVPAHHKGGIAATVEQHDGLLPGSRRRHQGLLQASGQHAEVTLGQLLAHIDDFYLRQYAAVRPHRQMQMRIFALLRLIIRA